MSAGKGTGSEAWLAHLWQARLLPDPLQTTDGKRVAIITPGLPNPDRGPDFLGAALLFDGRLLRQGDIEVHRSDRDWEAHGHAGDPHYHRVILHLVGDAGPGSVARGPDGTPIPVLIVPPELSVARSTEGPRYVAGGERPCQGLRARTEGRALSVALEELGRQRFLEHAQRFHHELRAASPEQVLYRALLEGMGYGRNQHAYRDLAERLPWHQLVMPSGSAEEPAGALSAALLAAAVPLTWDRFRLLPAARPEMRLQAMGRLLARMLPDGPASCCAAAVREGGGRPHELLRLLTVQRAHGDGGIGRDRAVALATNGVLPFLWAWSEGTGDGELAGAALALYQGLPASGGDRVTRWLDRMWGGPGARSAAEEQGQHHLYRGWCAAASCGRCPLMASLGTRPLGEGQARFDVQVPRRAVA